MIHLSRFVFMLFALVAPASLQAHHSFATEYDIGTTAQLEGRVTEVLFVNPHVEMYLEDDQGQSWNIQAQSVAALQSLGWNRDLVSSGDRVRVSGYRSRSGSLRLYMVELELEQGRLISVNRNPVAGDSGAVAVAGYELQQPPSEQLIARLPGTWYFDVDKRLPGAPLELEFWQQPDGSWTARLDQEELPVSLFGDRVRMLLHRENAGGFAVTLELVGRLDVDRILGSVAMIEGSTNQVNLDASEFIALRSPPAPSDNRSSDPFDLTGVWRRLIGVGPLGRTNPQLNELGMEVWSDFESGRYDPALRCMSVNPMRKYADPGLVEFIQSDQRLTVLYASKHDVRRVNLAQPEHNPDYPASIMGESIGRWEGGTLVIETTNFVPSVLTHNSEPVSSGATITERFWMEDGLLIMEARFEDPVYYRAPVMRRTAWQRADDAMMVSTSCDPDNFYRGMLFDGTIETYFQDRPAQQQP